MAGAVPVAYLILYSYRWQVLYLWQELLPYITSGDLIVPQGVEIIFTDAGACRARLLVVLESKVEHECFHE